MVTLTSLPILLNNLGHSLFTRFTCLEELSDLEDAISILRDVVDLTPLGHPAKPGYLNNLGNSFLVRFKHLGELSDLEDAISRHRDAVNLSPHGHPDKHTRVNSLGISLSARFGRLGELKDLEDALLAFRDAVELTPHGHPDKLTRVNNLGTSLKVRFERLGELNDLKDAISTLRDAVELTPHGHPEMPGHLNNLGNSLSARFERLGELNDLEDAISTLSDAVELTPQGHADKHRHLNNLGNSLKARFERLGDMNDLDDAISMLRDAVNLTPHGHPDKPGHLSALGNFLVTRFESLGELGDLEQAISMYLHAASAPIGPVRVRFHASQKWISCARRIRHHSLIHAYSIAICLLPQLAWIGLSLTHRYDELTRGANVVREAAAAALDSGLQETAVEWLEQGRSIVWGDLFQLRSSYEQLSSAHPRHAHRLRELSAALEHASTTRENFSSALLERTRSATQAVTEQEADRHRRLAIERDQLLREIRRFPGFEQFLLRKEFFQLRASAHSGPVVLLNAAESRCDALIVLADVDHVMHVPLPTFTFQRSAGLQKLVEKLLRDARIMQCDDREGKIATRSGVSWEPLLSTLWNGVVKPVLDALAFLVRHVVSLQFIPDSFIYLVSDSW
jgi:tetratricopeptide (TPR) repeat protein